LTMCGFGQLAVLVDQSLAVALKGFALEGDFRGQISPLPGALGQNRLPRGQFFIDAGRLLPRILKTLCHVASARFDRRPLSSQTDQVGLEFPHPRRLMPYRRFVPGRFFPHVGSTALGVPQTLVNRGDLTFDAGKRRLDLRDPIVPFLARAVLSGELPFRRSQLGRLFPILIGRESQPELAQLLGDLAILGRLDGLTANRVELGFDLVDDVARASARRRACDSCSG
jgi:hypothetical protein